MFVQRSVAFIAAVSVLSAVLPSQAATRRAVTPPKRNVIATGTLSNGASVTVTGNGYATIKNGNSVQIRRIPGDLRNLSENAAGMLDAQSTQDLMAALDSPQQPQLPYVPGVVNVVFRDGISPQHDLATYQPALQQNYTNDTRTNALFQKLGVDNVRRIARSVDRSRLAALRSSASAADRSVLNLANAYQIHLSGQSVPQAVRQLRKLQSVAYVAPDWIVSTMHTRAMTLDSKAVPSPSSIGAMSRARAQFTSSHSRTRMGMSAGSSAIPTNYAVRTSLSSWLNAPGVDDMAAYDEITNTFQGQLPGTGETITNVSIGDVCETGSPSTHLINGQHYLDIPGMNLIPEYVVDYDANISGTAQVCGVDPYLGEVLLDFSVMAPLPDGMQRAGAVASGSSDLMGIAPGANYRLVVPSDTSMSASAFVAAFLAASNQTPAPNVITASLGWGVDGSGFPGRYLEEDPLLHSVLSTIVNAQNIVVCISAGDGTRVYTNVAIGPHGGSAPTNQTTDTTQVTDLNDVVYSTTPSMVTDTGVIDVGGTTTDDILAANPADPQNAQYANQLTWPEVRWDGAQAFSSGFGTRVNISAPSDAIPALGLTGSGYNKTQLGISGGTSAAAPEVAAAAAVMLQVARLTGHPFTKATDVRDFLIANAVPVPNVPQADIDVHVGPQLNVRRGVEKLLANANMLPAPGLNRVAIAQRQLYKGRLHCAAQGSFLDNNGGTFIEATNPAYIHLDDIDGCNLPENKQLNSPITLAPDWESIPSGAQYKLFVTGHPNQVLGTGPWARLWPSQIFATAGMAASAPQSRNIALTYQAMQGPVLLASTTFDVTFGPTPATSNLVAAPVVAPVITGDTMTVSYDFSGIDPSQLNNPVIEVSMPGRMSPDAAEYFTPLYVSPVLAQNKGTIAIPVSALGGAGVYGVALNLYQQPMTYIDHGKTSLFAYTRVVATNSARPAAPLLSMPTDTTLTHGLSMPGHGSFNVQYDVSTVPGATGAMLEISADGPNVNNNMNPFNNPNGSVPDNNGIDTGSIFTQQLNGVSGTVTLTDTTAKLIPGMVHTIRVIPEMGMVGIGEASDVSALMLPAFSSPDGNSLKNGWAINTNAGGDDGVFTSTPIANQMTYGVSQIGVFSQSKLTTGNALNVAADPGSPYSLVGYVANDTMVYQVGLEQKQAPSFLTYVVSTGSRTSIPFTPVPQGWTLMEAARSNPTNMITAMLCSQVRGTNMNLGVMTMNAKSATSTAFIPLTPPFTGMMIAASAHIDYDPVNNIGYVFIEGEPANGNGFNPTDDILATINFGTSTVTYTHIGDFGSIKDFIVDPATHIGLATAYANNIHAAYQGGNMLFMDVNAGTLKSVVNVPLAGTYSAVMDVSKLALDPVNGWFAVQNPLPRADDTDNNPLSQIDFYDESGNFVKTTGRYYNLTSFTIMNHWFQLNPNTRTGFTFDNTGTQVIPFPY